MAQSAMAASAKPMQVVPASTRKSSSRGCRPGAQNCIRPFAADYGAVFQMNTDDPPAQNFDSIEGFDPGGSPMSGVGASANPVVAIFLGWAILSEPVTTRVIFAAVIIIGGVVMITALPQLLKRTVDGRR